MMEHVPHEWGILSLQITTPPLYPGNEVLPMQGEGSCSSVRAFTIILADAENLGFAYPAFIGSQFPSRPCIPRSLSSDGDEYRPVATVRDAKPWNFCWDRWVRKTLKWGRVYIWTCCQSTLSLCGNDMPLDLMANFVTLKLAFHLTPEDRRCTHLPLCLQIRGDWVEATPMDSKDALCYLSSWIQQNQKLFLQTNKT